MSRPPSSSDGSLRPSSAYPHGCERPISALPLGEGFARRPWRERLLHTAYHAPYYTPTDQQFALQSEGSVGGQAPLLIAYANFRLKRARFFLQMYNVGEALMTNERLSMYKYPYNPMHLSAGVVVDLNN